MEMDPYTVNLLFDGGFNPDIIYLVAGMHLLVIVSVIVSLVFGDKETR